MAGGGGGGGGGGGAGGGGGGGGHACSQSGIMNCGRYQSPLFRKSIFSFERGQLEKGNRLFR